MSTSVLNWKCDEVRRKYYFAPKWIKYFLRDDLGHSLMMIPLTTEYLCQQNILCPPPPPFHAQLVMSSEKLFDCKNIFLDKLSSQTHLLEWWKRRQMIKRLLDVIQNEHLKHYCHWINFAAHNFTRLECLANQFWNLFCWLRTQAKYGRSFCVYEVREVGKLSLKDNNIAESPMSWCHNNNNAEVWEVTQCLINESL